MTTTPKKTDLTDARQKGKPLPELEEASKVVGWEPPIPLSVRGLPPFPVHVFPPWLETFVLAVASSTQTPADLAGVLSLAVLSTCCAKVAQVRLPHDEPLNLFLAVAMLPGSRKSAVFRRVTKVLSEFEKAAGEKVAQERDRLETRREIATKKLASAKNAAADNSLGPEDYQVALQEANRLTDELAAIKVPTIPQLWTDDCTPERIAGLLLEQGGRLAILSPEGGVFQQMAGRYSANGDANLDPYLKGHAGDDIRVDRQTRKERVEEPALTVGLAVQPDVLRSLRNTPAFKGRGLLGRILYSIPPDLVGSGLRQFPAPPMPEEVAREYENRILALLSDLPMGKPPMMLRTTLEAQEVFLEFQRRLEPHLALTGELGSVRDWGSKLAGAVGRMAALLHLADHAGDPAGMARPIPATTMLRGVALGRYFIPHALAAYTEMGTAPEVDGAHLVLSWLKKRGRTTFTRREAQQALKHHFPQVELIEGPLKMLCQHEFIRLREEPARAAGPKGGRPPGPSYEVSPYVFQAPQNPQNPQNATPGLLRVARVAEETSDSALLTSLSEGLLSSESSEGFGGEKEVQMPPPEPPSGVEDSP